MGSGVPNNQRWDAYRKTLLDRIGTTRGLPEPSRTRKKSPNAWCSPKPTITAFEGGERPRRRHAQPILLGRRSVIEGLIEEHSLS